MASGKRQKRKEKKAAARRAKRALRRRQGLVAGPILVDLPAGMQKMSEVFLEFLEPYADVWKNEEEFRKLIVLGMVAWNAAVAVGARREELIRDTLETIPAEIRQDAVNIVQEMIRRKEAYFADDKRLIIDYELRWDPSNPHLSVLYAPDQIK